MNGQALFCQGRLNEKLFGKEERMLTLSATSKPRLALYLDPSKARPWKGVVWHHSAGGGRTARSWQELADYHTSYRIDFQPVSRDEFDDRLKAHQGAVFQQPWKTVGYHCGTEWINGQGILHWGRPMHIMGIHTRVKGVSNLFNQEFLGFCAVGNFEQAAPSPEFWEFNLRLTRTFMDLFQIQRENVLCHREALERLGVETDETCPGQCWDMEVFREDL
jgi:hypothetical protein